MIRIHEDVSVYDKWYNQLRIRLGTNQESSIQYIEPTTTKSGDVTADTLDMHYAFMKYIKNLGIETATKRHAWSNELKA